MKKVLPIIVVTLFLISCETQEDTIDEFLKEGERVSVGKVEDVMISHGVEKLRLGFVINGDPKVTQLLLQNGNLDTLSLFDISRNRVGQDTIVQTYSFPERFYNFRVTALDDQGNKSLPTEFVSRVYGDTYRKFVSARTITGVTASGASATVSFGPIRDEMVNTRLTYTTNTDVQQTIIISNADNSVVVSDYKAGTSFSVVSAYNPPLPEDQTAFEVFVSFDSKSAMFP